MAYGLWFNAKLIQNIQNIQINQNIQNIQNIQIIRTTSLFTTKKGAPHENIGTRRLRPHPHP